MPFTILFLLVVSCFSKGGNVCFFLEQILLHSDGSLSHLVPRLFPFLSHGIQSVRFSCLNTIKTLMGTSNGGFALHFLPLSACMPDLCTKMRMEFCANRTKDMTCIDGFQTDGAHYIIKFYEPSLASLCSSYKACIFTRAILGYPKMPNIWCGVQVYKQGWNNCNLKFYRSPANQQRQELWKKTVGLKDWKAKSHSQICGHALLYPW